MRRQVIILTAFRLIFVCMVTIDQIYASVGCLRSETGSEYLGEQNVTSSGRPCVRWDEVQGAFRDYIRITFLALPDRNASNAKNFCRNPNNDSRGVWCFVNLLGNVQFCNVPRCPTLTPPSISTTSSSTPSSTSTQAPASTTVMAISPTTTATSQVTSTFLVTKATSPSFRHGLGVGLGWEGDDETAAGVDETISDYVKPVVMSNNFEEMSAPKSTGVVTDMPISTPNTIYLTLKQPTSATFDSSNNMIDLSADPLTTTQPSTQQPPNYQRRPFDEWEEDPENSVSADDTPSSSWQTVDSETHPGGLSEKIYSEDIPGAVKIRTGGNILLGAKKDLENEGTKVVIQRSSQLASPTSSSSQNTYSLLLINFLIITISLINKN